MSHCGTTGGGGSAPRPPLFPATRCENLARRAAHRRRLPLAETAFLALSLAICLALTAGFVG